VSEIDVRAGLRTRHQLTVRGKRDSAVRWDVPAGAELATASESAHCDTGRACSKMPVAPRMQGWLVSAPVGHALLNGSRWIAADPLRGQHSCGGADGCSLG